MKDAVELVLANNAAMPLPPVNLVRSGSWSRACKRYGFLAENISFKIAYTTLKLDFLYSSQVNSVYPSRRRFRSSRDTGLSHVIFRFKFLKYSNSCSKQIWMAVLSSFQNLNFPRREVARHGVWARHRRASHGIGPNVQTKSIFGAPPRGRRHPHFL